VHAREGGGQQKLAAGLCAAPLRATADRIAELIPNAQRKTVKDQTHQAAPEAVAPLLIEFFGERN
jgi:hypothetical protein